jgi:hypothetical protein
MTEKKYVRAILIDPVAKTVTEVEHDAKDFTDIHRLLSDPENGLKVGCFTAVGIDRHHHVFVDDNGLLEDPKHFFEWKGYGQPLAGRGLVLATDEAGDTVAAMISLDAVKAAVSFNDGIVFEGFKPIPPGTTRMIGGKPWPVFGQTPMFSRRNAR